MTRCKICGALLDNKKAEICIICYEDFITGERRVGDVRSGPKDPENAAVMRLLKTNDLLEEELKTAYNTIESQRRVIGTLRGKLRGLKENGHA